MKKVVIATDHAGFLLKEELIPFVRSLGYEVEDMGAESLDTADDYPDIIAPAVKIVSDDPEHTRAIILGGSGQGEAMVANRFSSVRTAVYYGGDMNIISLSREHNDANVLSLGARFLAVDEAKSAVKIWLETKFKGEERHKRRIGKIEKITEQINR